ncbi:PREDICTED: DNA-directed RNA polymerase II subunit RPB1-like [Wasmannia auropunctata]|uniref:DNA-directed RNA polymerase II subunit RPB1-like n=1 Tax=Wasmannia auropunctata TaxID=64793 RepID=UPI0005F07E5F|nr:PREDICTED: DNA-directed RNA polymerase II subunit RPB1-like [Wasmannia auropunctata]
MLMLPSKWVIYILLVINCVGAHWSRVSRQAGYSYQRPNVPFSLPTERSGQQGYPSSQPSYSYPAPTPPPPPPPPPSRGYPSSQPSYSYPAPTPPPPPPSPPTRGYPSSRPSVSSFVPSPSSGFPTTGVIKLSGPAGGSSFATASSSASASAFSETFIGQQNYPSQSSVSIPAVPSYSPTGPTVSYPSTSGYPSTTPGYPSVTPGYPSSTPGYPSVTPLLPSPTAGYR